MESADALHSIARDFGPRAAREKLRRLDELADAKKLGAAALRRVRAGLDFIRAYPDDRQVLARVREVIAGLPARPPVAYAYSYGSVQRLVRIAKGQIEIDWNEFEEPGLLQGVLELLVTRGETMGLDDDRISLEEWFQKCRPGAHETDLEYVVALLEDSGLSSRAQTHLYNRCELPLRFGGLASCEVSLPIARVHYQRRPVERGSFPLEPAIRKRPHSIRRGGQAHVDVAVAALCARKLEIYPLLHASAADVTIVEGELGVRVVLIGVQPDFRAPLESLYFYLVLKY